MPHGRIFPTLALASRRPRSPSTQNVLNHTMSGCGNASAPYKYRGYQALVQLELNIAVDPRPTPRTMPSSSMGHQQKYLFLGGV